MRDYCKECGLDEKVYDDYFRLRFLRARKFDMDKTKLMFNNALTWRRENEVDQIFEVIPNHNLALMYFRYLSLKKANKFRNTTPIITIRLTEREDLSILKDKAS